MARRHHFHVREVCFQPGDDEVQRGFVVDRMALAPFVRSQRLAGFVLHDEMRIALHAVDPAATQHGQRPSGIHRVGGELHAGRP